MSRVKEMAGSGALFRQTASTSAWVWACCGARVSPHARTRCGMMHAWSLRRSLLASAFGYRPSAQTSRTSGGLFVAGDGTRWTATSQHEHEKRAP